MPDTINSFFTIESLITYGGASIGVVVASNTLRTVLRINNAWPPFIISLSICFFGVYHVKETITLTDGVVAFFNSCLLFTSATGIDQGLVRVVHGKPAGKSEQQGRAKVPWISSWF
jgi:hypothetical protein